MEVLLQWIKNYPELADLFQSAAVLLTGICAVIAGILGFRGAKAQADALMNIHRIENDKKIQQEKEEVQGSAAALAAELTAMSIDIIQIRSQAKFLLDGPIKSKRALNNVSSLSEQTQYSQEIKMGLRFLLELAQKIGLSRDVFMHNPTVVAKFGPDLAKRIVSAYSDFKDTIISNNHMLHTCIKYNNYIESGPIEAIIGNCDSFLHDIGKTIFALMEKADINEYEMRKWKNWARDNSLLIR